MVLLSFLLVLAAAVTLVIGLLNGGLGLIYLSIGCSLGAGIVLAIAVARSRPKAVPALGGPAPIEGGWGEEPTAVATRTVRRQEAAVGYDPATLPIAGYDGLKVTDILPLLPELEPDELEQVRAHEAGGKNRSRILGRIEMLTAEASWEAPAEGAEEAWEPEPAAVGAGRTATRTAVRRAAPTVVDEDLDEADFDEFDDEDSFDEDAFDDEDLFDEDFGDDVFPIADYDELKVGEIMPLLVELDDDELDLVRDREERGQARGMIINRIDRLRGGPPPKAAARKTTGARRPSGAKKTGPKKTAGAKKAAKRAPAKKAAAKKTAAKKAPARKSSRATAKKTAAKRR